MDNLEFLRRLRWGQWSTPYSRKENSDRLGNLDAIKALRTVNKVADWLAGNTPRSKTNGCRPGHGQIPRPQVVLFGAKGSGKTSVLESFIGNGFLPKQSSGLAGEGDVSQRVVTVCPVVIHIVRVKPAIGIRQVWWVEFAHQGPYPPKVLESSKIEEEIQKEMTRLSGESPDGVSEKELTLTYYSSEATDMTIIDLPGLNLSTEEKLLSKVDNKIKNIAMKYIRQKDSVILAVMPAHDENITDLTLRFIKSSGVDPTEQRTLAVLSHWDKLESKLRGHQILLCRQVKIDLGVIGIKNRTQVEVRNKVSVQTCQVENEHFILKNHQDVSKSITGVGLGPRYLVERVCEILIYLWGLRISENPEIQKKILQLIIPENPQDARKENLLARLAACNVNVPASWHVQKRRLHPDTEFVHKLIKKNWKQFGVEGSLTRHRQVSEKFHSDYVSINYN